MIFLAAEDVGIGVHLLVDGGGRHILRAGNQHQPLRVRQVGGGRFVYRGGRGQPMTRDHVAGNGGAHAHQETRAGRGRRCGRRRQGRFVRERIGLRLAVGTIAVAVLLGGRVGRGRGRRRLGRRRRLGNRWVGNCWISGRRRWRRRLGRRCRRFGRSGGGGV